VEVGLSTGGTFTLGASNVINNSATLTLAGGTFQTGGFSEGSLAGGTATSGLGAFRLGGGDSVLDFGGTSTLVFSGFNSQISGTVSITNWNLGVDRFLIAGSNSTLFNSEYAGRIAFDGFGGFTTTQYDNYFEVIAAVPEPSALMLGSIGVGLLGFRRRRKV
jgi:hypothetical protein